MTLVISPHLLWALLLLCSIWAAAISIYYLRGFLPIPSNPESIFERSRSCWRAFAWSLLAVLLFEVSLGFRPTPYEHTRMVERPEATLSPIAPLDREVSAPIPPSPHVAGELPHYD